MCPVCFARTSKQTDVAINTAEAADAIVERNRWRETIWQKVKDCEAAEPLVQLIRMGSRYQPCGLTASNVIYDGFLIDNVGAAGSFAPFTAFGGNLLFTGAGTSAIVQISGSVTVSANGQLVIQGAQRTSNAAATIYKRGSNFIVFN